MSLPTTSREYRSYGVSHQDFKLQEAPLSKPRASKVTIKIHASLSRYLGPVALKGGNYVIVLGTGGVSIFGAQIALASGAHVIATSSSDDSLRWPTSSVCSTSGKAITFRGILIGSVKQFEDMNRLFIARQIRPVIDKVFPFEQAIDAYSHLESQKHVGKVVIKVSKN